MGIFDRWKRKPKSETLETPVVDRPKNHLAFVLLDDARLPEAAAIFECFERYKGDSETLSLPEADEADDSSEDGSVLMLNVDGVGILCVALVDIPIPNQEAEQNLDYSLSAMNGDKSLTPHGAHLMVTLMGINETVTPLSSMMAFTSALAAVTEASGASAVYWGNAGATHPADFVLSVAQDHSVMPRVFLWNGFSRGDEGGGRMSFLSRGMSQFGLPDLYMLASIQNAGQELQRFYQYLAYLAEIGKPIPQGDTIGSSENERITVSYVPSPADDDSVVWKISV
jgi:hypothetical protein